MQASWDLEAMTGVTSSDDEHCQRSASERTFLCDEPLAVNGEAFGDPNCDNVWMEGLVPDDANILPNTKSGNPESGTSAGKATHVGGEAAPVSKGGQSLFVGKEVLVKEEVQRVELVFRRHFIEDCASQDAALQKCSELHRMINARKEWVQMLLSQEIWRPVILALLSQLMSFLAVLEARLDALEANQSGQPLGERVHLVVMMQDFGRPVLLKELVGAVGLKLVCAPQLALSWSPKDVSVRVVHLEDNSHAEVKLKVPKEPSSHPVSQFITFPGLSFAKGTRSRLVRLQFSCVVKAQNKPGAWSSKSAYSRPFVVITSKNQWSAALEAIVINELYPDGTDTVPQCVVANKIQRVYLQVTKQSMSDPVRPLSMWELMFIMEKYVQAKDANEANVVTRSQFRAFWGSFGPVLSRIHHDSVVREMWCRGYIAGFVTKEVCERLLITEPPGTFVVRFSSQAPGSLAVAYSTPEGEAVSHYLISKNDVNMACPLDAFLGQKPIFRYLLRAVGSFRTEVSWTRVGKSEALGKSFDSDAQVDGYDEDLHLRVGGSGS
jgi:hypothetical protein